MKDKAVVKPATQITQLKKDKFVDFYRETKGHISDSCRAVGIERKTYYNWLEKDAAFRDGIIEAEQELNDDIRNVLIEKAADQDMTAVIFYLKNRHPDFKQQPTIAQQFNVKGEMGVEFVEDEKV